MGFGGSCPSKCHARTDDPHYRSVITLQLSPNDWYPQQHVRGLRFDGSHLVQVDFLEEFAAIPAEEPGCSEKKKSVIGDGHYRLRVDVSYPRTWFTDGLGDDPFSRMEDAVNSLPPGLSLHAPTRYSDYPLGRQSKSHAQCAGAGT